MGVENRKKGERKTYEERKGESSERRGGGGGNNDRKRRREGLRESRGGGLIGNYCKPKPPWR